MMSLLIRLKYLIIILSAPTQEGGSKSKSNGLILVRVKNIISSGAPTFFKGRPVIGRCTFDSYSDL
jgi:hypothetical protein